MYFPPFWKQKSLDPVFTRYRRLRQMMNAQN